MTIAPPTRQLNLLTIAPSYRITKNAQARNAYGQVASDLVCAALGLTVIPIGRYDACFDGHRCNTFYEIKSVKRSGKVVIYDWRMDKEAASGVDLSYAILLHNVRGSDGSKLVEEMVASSIELIVLPASLVHEAAAKEPLRKLTKLALEPNGYNRKGYILGYRNVPVARLKALAPTCTPLTFNYAHLHGITATLHTL